MMKFKGKDHRSLSMDAFCPWVKVLDNTAFKRNPVMFLQSMRFLICWKRFKLKIRKLYRKNNE
jgi:hypothetical protein